MFYYVEVDDHIEFFRGFQLKQIADHEINVWAAIDQLRLFDFSRAHFKPSHVRAMLTQKDASETRAATYFQNPIGFLDKSCHELVAREANQKSQQIVFY